MSTTIELPWTPAEFAKLRQEQDERRAAFVATVGADDYERLARIVSSCRSDIDLMVALYHERKAAEGERDEATCALEVIKSEVVALRAVEDAAREMLSCDAVSLDASQQCSCVDDLHESLANLATPVTLAVRP